MLPKYTLDKIKFGTDAPIFEKAVALYENGKVTQFKEELNGFFAVVLGTHPYNVYVEKSHYDRGDCDCYLGQNETLCKHMVAVAIYAVMDGKKLSNVDKQTIGGPVCNGKLGELSKSELSNVKKEISGTMKYIKSYVGPSKTWFAYQNSLSEGCARLSKIISELPVGEKTSKLLVDLLLRLDEKLCRGGVDDSDGVLGGFIDETVIVLQEFAKLCPDCKNTFVALRNRETCFGWEESLVKLIED